MKKHELWEYFDAIQLPEQTREAVLHQVLHPEEGGSSVKHIWNVSRLVAVAVVVCLITVGVCVAANVFQWNEKFAELFQPTASQMEALQGATNQPQVSATQNGVTVTVRQTLADQHGIYVLYDVEGPADVTFTDQMAWKNKDLKINYEENSVEERTYLMGFCGSRVVSQEGNKRTELYYSNGNGLIQKNQELTLCLKDLGYYEYENAALKDLNREPESTYHTVIEGEWKLTWEFAYENLTKSIPVNQPVLLSEEQGQLATLLSVEVSPMSLWVNVEGPGNLWGLYPIITFCDGTQVIIDSMDDQGSYFYVAYREKEGGIHHAVYQFDNITDLSEIASVTVGNVTVPIQ